MGLKGLLGFGVELDQIRHSGTLGKSCSMRAINRSTTGAAKGLKRYNRQASCGNTNSVASWQTICTGQSARPSSIQLPFQCRVRQYLQEKVISKTKPTDPFAQKEREG
jgi:hypothetical protein